LEIAPDGGCFVNTRQPTDVDNLFIRYRNYVRAHQIQSIDDDYDAPPGPVTSDSDVTEDMCSQEQELDEQLMNIGLYHPTLFGLLVAWMRESEFSIDCISSLSRDELDELMENIELFYSEIDDDFARPAPANAPPMIQGLSNISTIVEFIASLPC
jgi:hypothetical protein